VVHGALVPPGERRSASVLDDGQFVVLAREAADGVQVGEPGDGGEGDFAALVTA